MVASRVFLAFFGAHSVSAFVLRNDPSSKQLPLETENGIRLPSGVPALLRHFYIAGKGGFKNEFPEDAETIALVNAWEREAKDEPATKAPIDGIDDDVKACKSELPDKHAYANCILKAMVGEMANLDFLDKMPEGEKKNFCATTPEMFRTLAAILEARFNRSSASAAAAPPSNTTDTTQEGPSDAVFQQMQDLAFVQAALEQFDKFCKA